MNITLQNDDILERDEMFNISLAVPPSVGSRIVAGNRTSALAVIIDTGSKFSIVVEAICTHINFSYVAVYIFQTVNNRDRSCNGI